jgi:hypothetical protein
VHVCSNGYSSNDQHKLEITMASHVISQLLNVIDNTNSHVLQVLEEANRDVTGSMHKAKHSVAQLIKEQQASADALTASMQYEFEQTPSTPSARNLSFGKQVRFASSDPKTPGNARLTTADRAWHLQILCAVREKLMKRLRTYAADDVSLLRADLAAIDEIRQDIGKTNEAIASLRRSGQLPSRSLAAMDVTPPDLRWNVTSRHDDSSLHASLRQKFSSPSLDDRSQWSIRADMLQTPAPPVVDRENKLEELPTIQQNTNTRAEPSAWSGTSNPLTTTGGDPSNVRTHSTGMSDDNLQMSSSFPGSSTRSGVLPVRAPAVALFGKLNGSDTIDTMDAVDITKLAAAAHTAASTHDAPVDARLRELMKSVGCDDVLDWDLSADDSLQTTHQSLAEAPVSNTSGKGAARTAADIVVTPSKLAAGSLPATSFGDASIHTPSKPAGSADLEVVEMLSPLSNSSSSSEGEADQELFLSASSSSSSGESVEVPATAQATAPTRDISLENDACASPFGSSALTPIKQTDSSLLFIEDNVDISSSKTQYNVEYQHEVARRLFEDAPVAASYNTSADGNTSAIAKLLCGLRADKSPSVPSSPAHIAKPSQIPVPRASPTVVSPRKHVSTSSAVRRMSPSPSYDPVKYASPSKASPAKPPFVHPSPERIIHMAQELSAASKREQRYKRKLSKGKGSPRMAALPAASHPSYVESSEAFTRRYVVGVLSPSNAGNPSVTNAGLQSYNLRSSPTIVKLGSSPLRSPTEHKSFGIATAERRRNIGILSPSPSKENPMHSP